MIGKENYFNNIVIENFFILIKLELIHEEEF